MAKPWFRMYAEFAADPKVQMLSEADQRRFVMLLCIRCSNDAETFHDEEVAFQLRINIEEWACTKALLMSKNMIDEGNNPVSWQKRQFLSDSSTNRVQKHRERKAKQACNVSVTPPDTDTDTETTIALRGFDQFWLAYPKKVGKGAAEKAFAKARLNGHLPEVLKSIEVQKRSEQWQKDGGQYIPNPATWLNQKRWEDGEPAKAEKDWI